MTHTIITAIINTKNISACLLQSCCHFRVSCVSDSQPTWLAVLFITYDYKNNWQRQSHKLTAGFLPFFSNVLRRRQPSHSYLAVYRSGDKTRSAELSRLQHISHSFINSFIAIRYLGSWSGSLFFQSSQVWLIHSIGANPGVIKGCIPIF